MAWRKSILAKSEKSEMYAACGHRRVVTLQYQRRGVAAWHQNRREGKYQQHGSMAASKAAASARQAIAWRKASSVNVAKAGNQAAGMAAGKYGDVIASIISERHQRKMA